VSKNEPKRGVTDNFPMLVPVSDMETLKANGVPWTLATLRKKKCLGEHPDFFVNFDRKCLFNVTAFQEWAKREMEKQRAVGEKRKKRIDEILNEER